MVKHLFGINASGFPGYQLIPVLRTFFRFIFIIQLDIAGVFNLWFFLYKTFNYPGLASSWWVRR